MHAGGHPVLPEFNYHRYQWQNGRSYAGSCNVAWQLHPTSATDGGAVLVPGSHKSAVPNFEEDPFDPTGNACICQIIWSTHTRARARIIHTHTHTHYLGFTSILPVKHVEKCRIDNIVNAFCRPSWCGAPCDGGRRCIALYGGGNYPWRNSMD